MKIFAAALMAAVFAAGAAHASDVASHQPITGAGVFAVEGDEARSPQPVKGIEGTDAR
jgi:hypothetical protein